MVAIKNILLFVSATTALTILGDVSTIDTNVKALTSAVNRDSGGLFGAIPITNAESALDKSIQQGTTDAKATSQLSSADSNSVIAAIQNLTPDIQTSLQAVQSKKAQFAAAGLTSTVQNDLASLKSDTDSFANALIAIASADTKDQANSEAATIDGYFQTAINASTKGIFGNTGLREVLDLFGSEIACNFLNTSLGNVEAHK